MPLASGTKLGPFEVVSPLGAGGMGEVYRARDTRLGRDVAIKILPKELSADAARKQRFEREAKTISGLNHPNICTLHDVGSQDGVDYLVMECVEGETLAKRLEKGPLPLEQVLKYGAQIADALDKAHRAGIVHRDLKPGNVMLTSSGAKLLDFGLARPVAPAATLATLTMAAPAQTPVTQEGMVVGTFQYMSPEQVEGKEVDGRSDIFSLGAVLYEMLTGKRAFEGKSQLSVASAILEKEPAPISAVKPLPPPALEHIIRKCLAKTPDDRWQSASDIASELKWIQESSSQAFVSPILGRRRKTKDIVAWVIAGLAIVAMGVMLARWPNEKPSQESRHFSVPLPFSAHDMVLSPDGRTLAVVAYGESSGKNTIWIYEVGTQAARSLAGTEGVTYPFWSPDGRTLAFFADEKLKKVDLAGGPVQIICDAISGRGGTWNREGVIVFTPDASLGHGLYRVSASGGVPAVISKPDAARGEQSHRWPQFLPDGRHFLYLAANFAGRRKEVDAIFVGKLDSDEKQLVTQATTNAAYVEPGYLVYCREKTLFAQRFDMKRLAVAGEPTIVLAEITQLPQVARALFAATNNDLIVAQTGGGFALSQPAWFNRKGEELGTIRKPDLYGNVSLAPSGKTMAVDIADADSLVVDVWTRELQRDSEKRFTFDPAQHTDAVWSPDESQLVFASNQQIKDGPAGAFNLYVKSAGGAEEAVSIAQDEVNKVPADWSRNGKYILYVRGMELWYVAMPQLKSSLFLRGPSALKNGQFSPDGRWVAYTSNETGKWEIYVTSFPEAHGKWQVSVGGGEQPRWRGDGKELFYLSGEGKMMAAPVTVEGNFDAGKSVALFQATPRQPVSFNDYTAYDVSRDGQKFLILTQAKNPDTKPMTVVLNWDAELKKK